tara:strand:+ start:1849 stop:2793 length:945 start_codon:yes stop_codon:yes gene_type:complete
MKSKSIIILFIFQSLLFNQVIGEGLYLDDLLTYLKNNYTTSNVLSYNAARDVLYGDVEAELNDGQVFCIYTNYSINLPNGLDPSSYLYDNGMDCEHLWPQSMGASSSPMKSDMHHLRPCRSNVNSSRGNKPYNEINDNATNTWYWLNIQSGNIPSSNINEYSETNSSYFEPREESKGDVARSIFYFYTIYENVANDNFFNTQKDVLYQWHIQDPPTNIEIDRTWAIAAYQNNIPNPFIIDHSLIERAYFYTEPEYNLGDLNLDALINVVDVVLLVNYILGIDSLDDDSMQLADLDSNELINIVDVVTLINIILN